MGKKTATKKRTIDTRKKVMAIMLIAVLVIPLALQFTVFSPITAEGHEDEVVKKAEQLANQTGYSVNQILHLYDQGIGWNGVMESLSNNKKTGGDIDTESITESDSKLLIELKELGFNDEQINSSREMAQWIEYKLNEIKMFITDKEEEENQLYISLSDSYNKEEALYWITRLKQKDYSELQSIDEYLSSVQIESDLKILLEDKEEYSTHKTEKTIIYNKKVITVNDIDQKLMQLISSNNKNTDKDDKQPQMQGASKDDTKKIDVVNPKIKVKDIKPVNPADKIKDELNSITKDLNK